MMFEDAFYVLIKQSLFKNRNRHYSIISNYFWDSMLFSYEKLTTSPVAELLCIW